MAAKENSISSRPSRLPGRSSLNSRRAKAGPLRSSLRRPGRNRGGADFYVRKDFNPGVGLTVVIIGALVSAAFYWSGRDLIAYGILASAALIDLVVYGRLGDLTICYRCHAEFRGTYERRAGAFDLHTADVLEMEYQRKTGRR